MVRFHGFNSDCRILVLSMRRRYSVALIVETSSNYGRNLLDGIVRFKKTQSDWSVFLEEQDLRGGPPEWLTDWNGDGIICRSTNPEIAQMVRSRKIPFVDLNDRRSGESEFISLRSDDHAIGRLGARHLMARGFRNFGFLGFDQEAWSRRREESFVEELKEKRHGCSILKSKWASLSNREFAQPRKLSLAYERERITSWLKGLPKPVGVMASNDIAGKNILDCCLLAEIAVPEQVAVLGVDNNEVICNLCEPPLSSVVPNSEQIGFSAAERLARLMAGEKVTKRLQCFDPLDVRLRQSSSVYAIEDPDLANALSFLRTNACFGISVKQVLEHTTLSRSSLERRVRKLLGHSPQQEIRNCQLKQVRSLLTKTDMSIEQIAINCGFEHPEYLHVVFKREMNMTPGDYRKALSK